MIWNPRTNSPHVLLMALIASLFLGSCVYYNTFFHARQAFHEAEEARKKSPIDRPSIRASEYNIAIEKSLKVVEDHPNSKYYDDALHVLSVSYFHTKQYRKSERRARELLTNYPDSKYAREARLYLAKALLEQNEMDEAMQLFAELVQSDLSQSLRVEAAMALGKFHFDEKDHEEAEKYFRAVRDSLGDKAQQRVAQRYIADGYLDRWKFNDALGAYLQILGMDPDSKEKYYALFQASECAYRTFQFPTGRDYLRTLAEDEIYFDSLGIIKLKLAEGYELEDDLGQAEILYDEVATQEKIGRIAAEAYYNLGLIYQFDYDQLDQAKKYYDEVVQRSRQSDIGQDALQRSSDIGKLETFARSALDSAATQQTIDDAAYTQYLLAELYWFKLNKPDTAILEMQYIVDSFPSAFEAPKAMIALAEMTREHEDDGAKADSILGEMLSRYPSSDFVPEALELLDLRGTEADTGYALAYIKKAEDFWLDEEEPDSARAYYARVVENYPDSRYYLQARFALLWLTENYESPGDSSLIYAYSELADSFPGTDWAREADRRAYFRPRATPTGPLDDEELPEDSLQDDVFAFGDLTDSAEATYADPMTRIYRAPDGSQASDLPGDVRTIEIRDPFEYPTEAYASAWYGDLYFQIRLDFAGDVIEHVLVTSSGNDEIDRRAEDEVVSTRFDVSIFRPEHYELWFVYKLRIDLPPGLR